MPFIQWGIRIEMNRTRGWKKPPSKLRPNLSGKQAKTKAWKKQNESIFINYCLSNT
jgi:hypothetical protein